MAAQLSGGRLVVLSNRLPVTLRAGPDGRRRIERSAGGLVAALEPALRRRGGTWVGWSGAPGSPGAELDGAGGGYRIAPVALSQGEVRRYYQGFSNRTLWPLFHSFPTRMELARDEWLAYEEVNQRFARVAAAEGEDVSLFWIHDYQLMRAAAPLRRVRPGARIAFFLHVPFPAYDLFRILPWDRELLRGLLACDLVGFHCAGYAANFLDCVERLLGARVDREAGQVEHGERTVAIGVFPLGIDYELFERRAREASAEDERRERIVLGVDRLDYTKGLPEKLRAFERLLELHPEHRGRVVLLQIAEPSRGEVAEYQRQKREVDELVGRVNGRLGTPRWTPVRYLHRSVPPEELAGLYRDADVALVTPLRDGMNLVAKEYVASQLDDAGVLILSRLAGAAETMHEAIRVNPYNVDLVAESLHQALTMDAGERTARMRALQQRERRRDVHAWLEGFLRAAGGPPQRIRPVGAADLTAWLGAFAHGFRLSLFLDYDGTLAPIADHPSEARLPKSARDLIAACVGRPDTEVAVVSGRALADVRRHVDLDGVVLAGNHGLEIEGPGLAPFSHPDLPHFEARARAIADALRRACEPGAWVEAKGASLTLHYRQAEPAAQARIAERARAVIHDGGFQVREAHCAVEARPPLGWDKGHAVLHVLRARHGPAWSEGVRVVYVGDDDTDEDAFRVLQGLGVTFRVGHAERPTLAAHRLPNVEAVETLLRWVAERPAPPTAA
jgi:trehalose 6-phosphate synthase/phosphatase